MLVSWVKTTWISLSSIRLTKLAILNACREPRVLAVATRNVGLDAELGLVVVGWER